MKARARLLAKSERIATASLAADQQARGDVVKDNMSAPVERNYHPESVAASYPALAHRAILCRASGSMSKRSALALKMKGSWK